MCRYAYFIGKCFWSFKGAIYIPFEHWPKLFWMCNSDETGFLFDCPSLMLGIAIRCIQHSQAMLERGVCELAHSFFHWQYDIGEGPFIFHIIIVLYHVELSS